MNAQELQALIVDWHMGELRPEVKALLEAYLAQTPSAREESRRIEETLTVTKKAVQAHPELVPSPGTDLKEPAKAASNAGGAARRPPAGWLKIAAALALAGGACLFGYQLGAGSTAPAGTPATAGGGTEAVQASEIRPALAANTNPGPWARYRINGKGGGQGLLFTRVESNQFAKPEVR